MPLYKEAFKEKLEKLKTDINVLLGKQYQNGESSEYSIAMIQKLILFIDQMLQNNELQFFIDNKDKITKEFYYLDNNQGTFIPAIFNQQSLDFARILRDFLSTIDIDQDFDVNNWGKKAILALLAVNQTPAQWLEKYRKNLNISIRLYEEFARSQHINKQTTEISNNFFTTFDSITKIIKESKIDEAFEQASFLLTEYLKKIQQLPYLRLLTTDAWINQQAPYVMELVNGNFTRSARLDLMECLLNAEQKLNDLLPQDKQLHIVYDHLKSLVSETAIQTYQQSIADLQAQVAKQTQEYETGAHLSWWQPADKDKKTLLVEMSTNINKLNSYDILTASDACGICFQASAEHYNLVAKKNTVPGKCGEIIGNAMLGFLNLLFSRDEKNDAGMRDALARYEAAAEKRFASSAPTNNK